MREQDKNILLGIAMVIGTPVIVTAVLLILQAIK